MFDPGFLKWRYFGIFFPVHAIIVLFLSAPANKVSSDLPKWMLVVVLSYAITAIPFALAMNSKWITDDGRREFVALIFIGMVRGFAILDVGLLLDLPQTKPYLLRPLNSAVNVPLWFMILRFLIGSRNEFKDLFNELYVRNIKDRVSKVLPAKGKLQENEIARIEERVLQTLEPLRKNIEELSGAEMSLEDLEREKIIIQSFIEEKLRPLSHDLWRQQRISPPKLHYVRNLFRITFVTKSQFGYAIVPSFIFGVVGASTFESFAFAWRHSLLHLIIQVIVFLGYEYLYERLLNFRKYLNLIAIFLCVSVPYAIDPIFLSSYPSTSANFWAEIVAAGWFLLLSLTFAVAKSQTDFRRDLINTLLIDLEKSASINGSDAELAGKYARYLHGDIQSTLSSTQMQLQQASDKDDLALGKSSIEKLASVLRRDHHDYAIGDAISPISKFQQIIDAWEGIATISIDVEEGRFSDVTLLKVSEVIEELVSNSIRHGGATEISVSLTSSGSDVSVEFQDNGSPRKAGKTGVGSAMMKSVIGQFETRSDEDGNRTSFRVAR
jgi:two-component sensor histidine kinase